MNSDHIGYNLELVIEDLKQLQGIDKDKLAYLVHLHEVLLQHYINLSAIAGRLNARIMLCQTAKGRSQYGYTNAELEELFSQNGRLQATIDILNKLSSITQQKVKILTEK